MPKAEQLVATKNRGDMFLVDVPTFAAVCALGDVDAAATYLVLAAGTGADNRTSSWSREAVNNRTALNWRKANTCFDKLERKGFLRWISGKSGRTPRLDLPPIETRKAMAKAVETLVARIEQGIQPTTPKELATAGAGRSAGWLMCDDQGRWHSEPRRRIVPAFLPKSIVGDDKGNPVEGTTIVERIRKARDPLAMRLFVDLYYLQDMAECAGVDRQWLRLKFDRAATCAATGSTVVWTFRAATEVARVQYGPLAHHWREPTAEEKSARRNGARDLFDRVAILEDAGALEWAIYLTEDDTSDAALIFPVGVKRHGQMVWTELESIIGGYATRAACAIGGYPGQAHDWEARAPRDFILPADRLARKAALVGIPRLRHRARTTNVARWRQELIEASEAHKEVFRGIIGEKAPELLGEADRRLADFNVASKLVQGDLNGTGESGKHMPLLTERAAESEFRRPAGSWMSFLESEEAASIVDDVIAPIRRTSTGEGF